MQLAVRHEVPVALLQAYLLPPHKLGPQHQRPPHVHQRLEHAGDDRVETCQAVRHKHTTHCLDTCSTDSEHA